MTDKALTNLQEMVDRLDPDMGINLNQVAFERCFGVNGGAGQRATDFAQRNNLVARINEKRRTVEFFRPYEG
jgi:hypothetical protein